MRWYGGGRGRGEGVRRRRRGRGCNGGAGRGIETLTGGGREDVVVRTCEVRAPPKSLERAERLVREGDDTELAGLRGELDGAGERTLDVQHTLGEVGVAPAQGDQLALRSPV